MVEGIPPPRQAPTKKPPPGKERKPPGGGRRGQGQLGWPRLTIPTISLGERPQCAVTLAPTGTLPQLRSLGRPGNT